MKRKGKISLIIKTCISSFLIAAAAISLCCRIFQCFDSDSPAVFAAAAFTLTDGEYKAEEKEEDADQTSDKKQSDNKSDNTQISETTAAESSAGNSERSKEGYYDSFADHSGEEKYTITEKTYSSDGTKIFSCYVKNKTGLSVDFKSLLNSPLAFDISENSKDVQVLIYHTHTTEGYMDEDVNYFYESYYSRTQNTDYSVVAVGEAIVDELNKNGISAYHDTTVHDSTYNGSYDRSAETVETVMNKYKNISVVIDIHRDAIGSETNKIKPVFTYNNKKGAQIMILSGCDDGSGWFPNWKDNLSFALKIQNTAEEMYPGMTRPLDFDYFRYNEYICKGSLLIEIGTDANSIEEAEYSGTLLGNVLARVLKSN